MQRSESKPLFEKIALIGAGLIGSSIAHGIKNQNLAEKVSITAQSQDTLNTIIKLGLANEATLDQKKAVSDCELVIICAPLGSYSKIIQNIGSILEPGTIVSDVGSVKQSVIDDISPHISKNIHLIPAHPVAGTEHSGPNAGFAELFKDRWCIITPPSNAEQSALDKVSKFWETLGANIEIMTPDRHDMIMAMTSHLPHLIAYTIVGTASDLEKSLANEVIKFSAGGFRDFTRIAASDPTMWRDIFLNNREAVLEMLQRFSEDITALQRSIRWGEGDKLFDLFSRTRKARRAVIDAKQEKMYN
ncbi:MAG: prephenate/arogenate dehydrogenase family protein [Rhodospirillales bacterium]|tara:strand:- start:909 stop:1817 length:909 start_codon:yes stop_codon:yes gene_type:complete